jgi:hypothetical protein
MSLLPPSRDFATILSHAYHRFVSNEGSVEPKVDKAFDEVGVFAATRRNTKCKGALP